MGDLRLVAAVGVLALASAVAPRAQAQAPSASVKARAQQLAKEAAAKSQAGDHERAIDLYNQAYMLVPVPVLLSNIGAEYELAGKPADAVRYFCRYLKDDPQGPAASYAAGQVKTLQADLGNPVDDKDVCAAKPKPAVATTPKPTAVATTAPVAPAPPPPAAPQVQHVELRSAGGPDPGSELPPVGGGSAGEPTDQASHTLEYAGIGVAGAGAIAGGIGVYYMVRGKDLSDAISNHKVGTPWPSTIDGVAIANWPSAGHSDNVNAAVFSIIGGAALLTGVVMIVVGRPHASDTHVAVAPMATGSAWGLELSGGF
jgi:tetratricopeptide (TPR) repeat protein